MSSSIPIKWMALVLLLAGLWWCPWWLFLLGWLLAVTLLPEFYLGIIPALFFDLSYSANHAGLWGFSLPLTTATIILLIISRELHYQLRV